MSALCTNVKYKIYWSHLNIISNNTSLKPVQPKCTTYRGYPILVIIQMYYIYSGYPILVIIQMKVVLVKRKKDWF